MIKKVLINLATAAIMLMFIMAVAVVITLPILVAAVTVCTVFAVADPPYIPFTIIVYAMAVAGILLSLLLKNREAYDEAPAQS